MSPQHKQIPFNLKAWHPLSVLRMVWKQKSRFLLVFLGLEILALAIVSQLPPIYKAELLILVDSQKIPERFVSSTVNADLLDRVATMTQQVLSPDRLWKMILTHNLYQDERRSLAQQEVIEIMRNDIKITPERGFSQERQGAFRLSYMGKDPQAIASLVNQIGELLIQETLLARESLAQGTSEFIQRELDRAKQQLDEQEARLSAYKLSHNGALPQQEPALVATLDKLRVQTQGAQDEINRLHQTKLSLQNMLEFAKATEDQVRRLQGTKTGQTMDQKPSAAMEQELAQLLAKYTDEHPKVKAMRLNIARVKALEAGAAGPSGAGDVPGQGQSASLAAQVAATDRNIAQKMAELKRLSAELDGLQGRLQGIPLREQEMSQLMRDYETSKANYMSLLGKIFAADMASNMEKLQKAERFTILSPALVPLRPVKPNRPAVAFALTMAAIALAVVIVILREVKNNYILGEWELPSGLAVLGRVPIIEHDLKEDRKLAAAGQLASGAAIATALAALRWFGGGGGTQ